MTLEDFFTLTEMKDGLTAPVRVEELITVMQKEKDSLVKSVGEATREWAAVASTIAATENKECLDLFIQLDGLLFIDRWLKDAQTFPDEPSDCFVEEAISALLLAIEKLQLDTDKLTSSGICITVKSLLDYKSIRVQNKARALCDSWKTKDVDFESIDAEQAPVNNDPKLDNQDPESQLPMNDASPKKSLVDQKSEGAELGETKLTDVEDSSQIPSNHADSYCNNLGPNMVTSPAKVESIGGDPQREVCASDGNLNSGSVSIAAAMQDTDGDTDGMACEGLNPGSVDQDVKYETNVEMLRDKSGNIILSSTSDVPDSNDVSSNTDAKPAEGAFDKTDAGDHHKDESPMKITSGVNSNSFVGQSTNEMVDKAQNDLEQGDAFAINESKDQRTTMPSLDDEDDDNDDDDDDDEHNELKSYCKSEQRYLVKSCDFASLTKPGKTADILRETRDVDLEDGTVDALEVARLVANEVEREVGGYCEQSDSSTSSSSSSDRMSRGGITQQDIQKSINGEQEMEVNSPGSTPDASIKDPLMALGNIETKPKNSEDGDSSLVTDAVQDPQKNGEKGSWEFDLNQEFSSDDADHQVDTGSNPVSVVSASRAVVASEIPAGPLQFEGSLGWKGSAATSAFRPATLRRASDSVRALSGGATSSGCQQRQNFLDFDLNVAEGADDKVSNPVFDKQKQLLPGLTSHNSSAELSPKRSQRLTLDLNQVDDDVGFLAKEWKMGGQIFHPQNCHRSPSPASSSSCMQPSMRNFDLNDNLFNCNDSSDQPAFLGESSHKVNSSMVPEDDTFISILGTKVKRNAFPHAPSPTPNGKESEPLMDSSLLTGGPLMGLGPSAAPYPLGFNGLAMGSSVSLASAQIYRPGGPLPYVFDSRGAPFLPQMLGSATTVPPPYCQPSFVMNLMGATPGPNLAVPFRPNLDLNSGYTNVVGAGTPDPGFYRPLFIPHGQVRPSEEQMSLRDSFRPLGVGTSGGKRKEPDSGWDFFPATYKNQPPHL